MSGNGNKGLGGLAEVLRLSLMLLLVILGYIAADWLAWDLPVGTLALSSFLAVYGTYFVYRMVKR